jgi:hypothetical protein
VRCYDLQGEFKQFSLGHGAEASLVRDVKFYDDGLVALLGDNTLVAVSSYAEPRPRVLAALLPPELGAGGGSGINNSNNNGTAPPPPLPPTVHSWALVPPAQTLSRSVEVLLSVGQTILVVDASECEDKGLDVGPFGHVSVSPDGRLVALYNSSRGRVYIVTADFSEIVDEADMDSRIEPRFVGWCGREDALVAWEDEVRVVGSAGVSFIYDCDRVHVLPEPDGAHLLTNDSCEFLERVPAATQDVFGHAAESSPASILLDAVRQLELQSPKADDYIQLIRANLTEAVDTCVNAAGREFAVHWQKQLLKAASFGKSVLDLYNSDDFVDMCETLRVLNAARFFEIGMPLSYDEFQRLTPERLVRRLLSRHEYLLALRVATYLRLPTDRIYVHWASAKVRAATDDDDAVCRAIVDKLSGKPGISFDEIARAAYDEGRARLATELLNHEPRGGRQVPLLLSMEEDELALDKAIESGDSDLVHTVLHRLRAKLPLAAFFRTVSARPVAVALVEAEAARTRDAALLKDLYYQDDRRVDGASVFIRESLAQPDARTAADKLALAHKLLAETKERAFETQAVREASALLRVQEILDRDLNAEGFVGLSVAETMYRLVKLGYHGRAKKLQSEFRVPEKVFWWVRLRALVAKRDWNELEELSRTRKSPIGWEPFFNLVLGAGNPRLAATFVPKCTGLEQGATIAMYEKCNLRVKAAEEAVRLRDRDEWERLLAAVGENSPDGIEIERLGRAVFSKR